MIDRKSDILTRNYSRIWPRANPTVNEIKGTVWGQGVRGYGTRDTEHRTGGRGKGKGRTGAGAEVSIGREQKLGGRGTGQEQMTGDLGQGVRGQGTWDIGEEEEGKGRGRAGPWGRGKYRQGAEGRLQWHGTGGKDRSFGSGSRGHRTGARGEGKR